ncbi:MAG TPA: T9SS type A sorting domain-containing protein [Chitinophagales bacterium]|nr:T9SS type A sorting domain-containing protein [Chitinophagales bacterium]
MRKVLLSFILLFMFSGFAISQSCYPSATAVDSGFIYPPVDSFPCMVTGSAFSGVFQINMPDRFHGLVLIDSVFIDSIVGLPSGITYSTNPSPMILSGDSSGCVLLSGTAADSGNFTLTFICHAIVTSQSAGRESLSYQQLLQLGDAPIPNYIVQSIGPGDSCHANAITTGIPNVGSANEVNVYPNPSTNGQWHISLGYNFIGAPLEVYDVNGRLVYKMQIATASADISMNTAPGIYILRIPSAQGNVVRKLIKL